MPSYNKVLLMGNLTRDVELKHTPSNMAVANIGIATSRKFKGKDGEMKEETTFVDCEAWGATAENMAKFFSKGRPIFIEGRLKLDQWEDKDGSKKSKMRVVVESFQFVDSKGGGGSGGGDYGGTGSTEGAAPRRASTGSGSKSQPAYSGPAHEPLGDDDIPF